MSGIGTWATWARWRPQRLHRDMAGVSKHRYNVLMPRYRPIAERFWEKVHKGDGCWEWTAYRSADGYGMIGRERGDGVERAHRLSWELHFGPIPSGTAVLHRCDNPPCVRPSHLFLGTQTENVADSVAKGRHRSPVHYGERHHWARLTEAEVREIRAAFDIGIPCRDLADMFHIHPETVRLIGKRQTWAHIDTT